VRESESESVRERARERERERERGTQIHHEHGRVAHRGRQRQRQPCQVGTRRVWARRSGKFWLVANRATLLQKWPPFPRNAAGSCGLTETTKPMELSIFRGRVDNAQAASRIAGASASASPAHHKSISARIPGPPWRQPRGKSQVNLPQMLTPEGSI